MVETAAKLGVKYLGLSLTVTCDGKVENTFDKIMNENNANLFEDSEAHARETAQRLGVELHIQRPFRTVSRNEGRISLC